MARTVEERLIPINALIGLVTPGDLNPPVLWDAGFRLAGLEVPVITSEGEVVVDAVLANGSTGHILAAEAKSGANVEVDQARRYAALDPRSIAQSSYVDLQVQPQVEPLYVCLAENGSRITHGLDTIDVGVPVLTVDASKISLERPEHATAALLEIFARPVELRVPPPRWVPFDHESPDDVVHASVKASLVALMARRVQQVSLRSLTESAAQHFGLYATRTQGQMIRKVQEAARRIAQAQPDVFAFHPRRRNTDGLVQFLRNPEDNDPRGRTQAYQALGRGRRRQRPINPDQLDLFPALGAPPGPAEDSVGASEEDEGNQEVTP